MWIQKAGGPKMAKRTKTATRLKTVFITAKTSTGNLVIDERTEIVAKKLTEFLKGYDRFAKTIVFCSDIDHAERMRSALANQNADFVATTHKYIMQITGDNDEGKAGVRQFYCP